MGAPQPDKPDALRKMLSEGATLMHLDPRRAGVDVPEHLRELPVLQLKVSWNFANPLTIDEEGVSQRLTFPEGSYSCMVPWDALFALGRSGEAPRWVWPVSLPQEMLQLMQEAVDAEQLPSVPPQPPMDEAGISRGHLRLIKSN